jgi:hypothetical protein
VQISPDFVFQQAVVPLILYKELRYLSCDYDIAVPSHTTAKSSINKNKRSKVDRWFREVEGQYRH